MDQIAATLVGYDLRTTPLRDVNAALHQPGVEGEYVIAHPDGAHNVAVGLNAPIRVTVEGHVGYYAAGMNQLAEVTINGNAGRDHFPAAWSAVLAGAGIRTGIAHGETDADGAKVVKDVVTVPNLLATIATTLGLDPGDTAASPAGRPISLTDSGVPVKALLA